MVLPVATFESPHPSLVCKQQVVRDRFARAAITRGIGSPKLFGSPVTVRVRPRRTPFLDIRATIKR